MGAYTKATRAHGASDRMAAVHPLLPLIAAIVVAPGAAVSALADEQPAGIKSLLGQPLYAAALAPEDESRMKAQLAEAQAAWDKDRNDADALIWVGRRTAYLGGYREAIEIFSDGIARHPADARMFRHRGHRYLTVREIDKSIADFEKAVDLIRDREG